MFQLHFWGGVYKNGICYNSLQSRIVLKNIWGIHIIVVFKHAWSAKLKKMGKPKYLKIGKV